MAALARESGAPLVPVALWGSQRMWSVAPPGAPGPLPRPDWTRGRRVDVAYGEPLHVAPDMDLTEVTTALGHRITHLLEELQQLPHHRPGAGERAPWYPAHLGGHAPSRREAVHLDLVPRSAVSPVWGPQA
jgi:1-acyl-sn-glycerol-3-phosphate acyltransferase